ncbi:MAG: zinc-ribbon domain-containing protein [Candidatus Thorarchaeota archaeon]
MCNNCGAKNAQDSKFCSSCGAKMTMYNDGTSSQQTYGKPQSSIGFGNRYTGENLVLHCTLCGFQDFAKDKGRLDSKWGFTSFKVIMMTCKNCGHVEIFNKGRSIFDFD